MRNIVLSLFALILIVDASSAQSPALMKFFGELEGMNGRLSEAVTHGDKGALESIYADIVTLYDKQPRDVKDATAPMICGVWYNIACTRSSQGNSTGAIEALSKAVEYGWKDVEHMLKDIDLAVLRNNPHFKELVAKLR